MSTRKIWSELFNSRKIMVALCSFAVVIAIGLICGAWILSEEKEISLNVNGSEITVKTYANTVSDFLEERDIAAEKISDSNLDRSAALRDGERLVVEFVGDYRVRVDGRTHDVSAAAGTVADVLDKAGVILNDEDIVEPSLDTPAADGLVIDVRRVIIKDEVRETELAYSVEKKKDDAVVSGDQIVIRPGQTGLRSDTYRVTYCDGEFYSEELIASSVTDPVTEIVAVGTGDTVLTGAETSAAATNETKMAREDEKSTASDKAIPADMTSAKVVTMKATAYHEPPGSLTKSGTLSRVGAVAVDPRVIPLGTELYVEGYGYCVAEDTGRLIKGNRIDVYLDSEAECVEWGVKNVTVHVLE